MYHAKAQGRNNVQFSPPDERRRRRAPWAGRGHRAVAHQQLEIHYQPQVTASGQLCGNGEYCCASRTHARPGVAAEIHPGYRRIRLIQALSLGATPGLPASGELKRCGIHGVRMAVNLSARNCAHASW